MSTDRNTAAKKAPVVVGATYAEMLSKTGDISTPDLAESANQPIPPREPSRVRRSRRPLATATVLAELAVARAMTPSLRKALRGRGQVIAIFLVPSSQWIGPIRRVTAGAIDAHVMLRDGSERNTRFDDDEAVEAALGGRSVLVFATDLRLVPGSITVGADHIVTIAVPDGSIVGQVIRRVCRGSIACEVGTELIAGLDFDDLVLLIRPGRRAIDAVEALRRASSTRCAVSAEVEAPSLETSRSFGRARAWGLSLARDVEAVRRGEIAWSEVDRGAVLFGPPGTGKTLFAQSLAATCKLPIIVSSVSEYFTKSSGDLGAVTKAQRDVFTLASASAPVILFLDEIDAVPNRATISDRARDWWQTVINDFLLLLDSSISRRQGIIVVGATNRIEDIDAAILRPGRLERAIYLGPPDADGLEDVLRHHLRSDLQSVDLAPLAMRCAGATPATAMDWVRQARRAARAAGRPMILEDLEGAALPDVFRDAASAHRAAIHEAGHAVVGIVTGAHVESVSLGSAGTAGGRTRLHYDDVHFQLRDDLVGRILTLLAGRAAEQVLTGSVSTGAGGSDESDLAHATREMESMWARFGFGADLLYQPAARATGLLEDPVVRREIADELSAHYRRALELVAEHRDAIERIADALIARRFLTGEEVSRLM